MEPGNLYWADVPFLDGTGSKHRPVLVLRKLSDDTLIILASSSKYKPRKQLVASLNFDDPKYFESKLKGVSYFYRGGLIALRVDRFRNYIGPLPPADYQMIARKLKEFSK
jgi:hypothetical protein